MNTQTKKILKSPLTIVFFLSAILIISAFIIIVNSEKPFSESESNVCKYLLSNGACMAEDKIDLNLPKGFETECDEGYTETKEFSVGRVCVKSNENEIVDDPTYCTDEICYPIGITRNTDTSITKSFIPSSMKEKPILDAEEFVFNVSGIIELVQIHEMEDGVYTTKYGGCNFTIKYDREYENRFIWHDWKMAFKTFEKCDTPTRILIVDMYSNLIDERLLILDPPVTRTIENFQLQDWNGDYLGFYMELHSDGYRMIEFRTAEDGVQRIFLDDDESDPTKESLCLIYEIDITKDSSCMYRILNERIEALEEKHNEIAKGGASGITGTFELIPENTIKTKKDSSGDKI